MKRGHLFSWATICSALLVIAGIASGTRAYASASNSDFNLQVTPSPLVATVEPGTKTKLVLKIHNGGTSPEDLKIEPRAFTYSDNTQQVNLEDTEPAAISTWISFSQARFTIQPGQWINEEVTLNVPKTAGFSYSFALVISPQSVPTPTGSGRLIQGSLAVFTLLNVDRPGATSSLKIVSFTSTKHLYEYLPATLSVRFHNNGNTIMQPYGNIFIERSANAKTPLATLTVNPSRSYILPGTERTVSAQWNDGFTTYQSTRQPDGSLSQHLVVNWSDLSRFRIGRYTAKLVAVYDDGNHDVPIEGTVSFWVVPWRAILVFLVVVVGLWLFARWRNKRRTEKAVRRALTQADANRKAADKKEVQS